MMSFHLSPLQRRLFITIISIGLGFLFILILHLFLEQDSKFARLWLDYRKGNELYPFTVQNAQWLIFFIGLGELWGRVQDALSESLQLRKHYLPEDERTVLQLTDLGPIYRRIRDQAGNTELFLPRLILRTILQFQSSHSIDQANTLLNSSLDLYLHEIDLRYNMLRYIMWFIPSLGFLGTVIGITEALNYAGRTNLQDPQLLYQLSLLLGIAFYTTLLALLQAAILVFGVHLVQASEERSLNRAGQYCLDNLINRLYNP
jgi:biopolymer transport protein ExbB/TolQ